MLVYFAHPYDTVGTPREAALLREMTKRGWEVLNPFKHNPDEEIIERIKEGEFSAYDARILVENDLDNLNGCDTVLVWIPDGARAVGTICEMVYAFKAHKYIIVIHQRDYALHSWVVYHADLVYKNINDFIAMISVTLQQQRR